MEKWTFQEGIEKLLPDNLEEAELNDLGIAKRPLVLDVSFALGKEEDGVQGLSVILTLPESSIGEGYIHFSAETIYPDEGETLQALAARIAQDLGIAPDERIWEDGEDI